MSFTVLAGFINALKKNNNPRAVQNAAEKFVNAVGELEMRLTRFSEQDKNDDRGKIYQDCL